MALQTSITIEATDDLDIRNEKASCLNAIPVERYLKQKVLIICFSEDEAKKKWRNLRDQFTKELRKIPKPKSGDAASDYPGKWQYFTALLFLKDTLMPRNTDGNVPDTEDTEEIVGDDEPTTVEESDEIELGCDTSNNLRSQNTINNFSQVSGKEPLISPGPRSPNIDSETILSQSPASSRSSSRQCFQTERPSCSGNKVAASRPLKTKRKEESKDSLERQLLQIEAKKLALLEMPEDHDFMFLKSLLPYFKQMHPLQKLRIRNKFQDILIAEMTPPMSSNTTYSYTSSPSSSVPLGSPTENTPFNMMPHPESTQYAHSSETSIQTFYTQFTDTT